jgi:hypothetical protein
MSFQRRHRHRQSREGRSAVHGVSRQPAAGRLVKRLRFALADHQADPERVVEVDLRQLGGSGADQREVAGVQRAAEARVWRTLDRHTTARFLLEVVAVLDAGLTAVERA